MNKKILVVEDSKLIRERCKFILQAAEYDVATADNGLKAFNHIIEAKKKREPFDYLIGDMFMPKVSGLHFIRMLKSSDINIPFIPIIGLHDKELRRKMILEGCEIFIYRPIQVKKIMDKIIPYLESKLLEKI